MKHNVHQLRMIEMDLKNEQSLTRQMFDEALEDLKKNKSEKYKFIIKGGDDFKLAVFNLFNYIWENESKPDQWRLDTLLQLHKKGSKLKLDNYRYIHIKEEIPKLFGFIVTKELKNKIIESFSRYQIGAAPGHRPQEHLFCVRSLISLFKLMKKPLILSFYDISKFFDKELLADA